MKRSHTSRGVRAMLALVFATLGFMPGVSHAAAPVVSYFQIKTYPITPYNSSDVKFFGHVDNFTNDVKINVWARDTIVDFTINARPEYQRIWYSDDAGTGNFRGDFEGIIEITDLGTHDGTASSVDIFAQAENAANEKSDVVVIRVSKNSADPLDVYNPTLNIPRRPPGTWCHINPTCSTNKPTPLIPGCRSNPIGTPGITPAPPLPPIPPITIIPAQTIPPSFCYVNLPNGQTQLSGNVQDATNGTGFIGSEVKDIIITISNSSGQVIQTFHNLLRSGTTAFFAQNLKITDYNPGTYTWKVTAFDALDHKAEISGTFTVTGDGCPNPPIC